MVELGGIIILGILAQWIAWRLKVPAILPLIIIGLIVGPFSSLWTEGGLKWIEPMWNEELHHGLFPGEHLFHFVELAIGIILFEGGLTLKRRELKGVGSSIFNLITLGAAVTFFTAGILCHYIIGLSWPLSFLFSGLIIVTGPTVVAPILRNLPLKRNVASVLKWEGILIDPVGALVAVLCYEFIVSTAGTGAYMGETITSLFKIVFIGFGFGGLMSIGLKEILKRDLVPHYLLTIFTLAYVLAIFVGSNILVHDSGLTSVVIAGMVLGNMEVPHIKEIEYFKESISVLLISVLFILLSANITIEQLQILQDWRCIALLACVILLVRPLGVFLSSQGSDLNTKEKMFISWVGPRGIVAAGIASLFGSKLVIQGVEGAEYITPLVFMIVLGTVLLNATTAGIIGKWLGVMFNKSNGVLIVGANASARLIGKFLVDKGKHVVMIDSNANNIEKAKTLGIKAFQENVYTGDMSDNIELSDVGYMLALTSSSDVNNYAINKFKDAYGENGAYRLSTLEELRNPDIVSETALFSGQNDYITFTEISRDYPVFHEKEVNNEGEFLTIKEQLDGEKKSIPICTIAPDGAIQFVRSQSTHAALKDGSKLVYLGKSLPEEVPAGETE